jgi:hypothetical protein
MRLGLLVSLYVKERDALGVGGCYQVIRTLLASTHKARSEGLCRCLMSLQFCKWLRCVEYKEHFCI